MYTFLHRHCAQCAKNQCHTANISIERHVEAASCCYDGHQNGRGLYGCLPSNAGRSCNSLRQLRQARICRRISWVCGGFVLPYKGTKKAREMQIKMLLFSFPSAQVARHGQGTTFLRHSQEMSRQISAYFLDLSGLIWTYLDKSGQWLRQLSYLCIVNPERHADGAGFTPRQRRKCRSAEQQKTGPDPLPRG